MTFIPKPQNSNRRLKENEFTPIKPAFRDRQYGSEFNKWEFNILKEFAYAKRSATPSVSGTVIYDGKLGRNRFLIIPAAHLSQDYIICECPIGMKIPANLAYVNVTGQRRVFHDYWEIMVDDIASAKIKNPIEPEIDFKEFQQQLFLQWAGIFSPLRDLLAFEFVSSPRMPNFGQAGGLNITLYDGTDRKLSRKLFKYFYDLMPPDIALGKSGNLTVPELAAEQPLSPFTWQFRSFDADKPLNQHLATFLERRKSRRFSEISVGLGSRRSQPQSLYDPPFRLVDQPTLLANSAEMRKMYFDPPLEVTKYIVTMQMLTPTIGKTQDDIDNTLEQTSQKIISIAEKFDMPQEVQQHHIFDANYYGKPQSTLRLALASARSQEIDSVDNQMVSKAFDNFYLKNLEEIFEAWDDLFTTKGVELASLNEFDRSVLKFINDKESSEFGVSFDNLSDRFAPEDLDSSRRVNLLQSIQRLREAGKIRESKSLVYRSVPFAQ